MKAYRLVKITQGRKIEYEVQELRKGWFGSKWVSCSSAYESIEYAKVVRDSFIAKALPIAIEVME